MIAASALLLLLVLIACGYLFYSQAESADDFTQLPLAVISIDDPIEAELANMMPLSQWSQSDYIIHVWATWCGLCKKEHPSLIKAQQDYPLPVVGVALQDQPKKVQGYLIEKGNPYALVLDDIDGELSERLGVQATPQTFLVSEGEIVFAHAGPLNENEWVALFSRLQTQIAKRLSNKNDH